MPMYKGYDIKVNDPETWPKGGASGKTVVTIELDQDEVDTLSSIGDFHADNEFPKGQWPFCPDALERIRQKIAPHETPIGEPPVPPQTDDTDPIAEQRMDAADVASFDAFVAKVDAITGRSITADYVEDGFSLNDAHHAHACGVTPEAHASGIVNRIENEQERDYDRQQESLMENGPGPTLLEQQQAAQKLK